MENKVLEVLVNAGKPLRPGDIAKELGVDSKEVSKAIAELKKEGKNPVFDPVKFGIEDKTGAWKRK